MKKVRTHLLATAAVVALSGSAFAADMGVPMKAPPPAPIPYTGWQGFYLGGAIGAARLNTTANSSETFSGGGSEAQAPCGDFLNSSTVACSTGTTGFTAGVQAGYDWQSRYFVYGVVADWTWTGLKHSINRGNGSSHGVFQAKVDWLATFRGRMGLAVDDTLVYFTGGLALAELKSSASAGFDVCGGACGFGGITWNNSLNTVHAGWVAGLGVEHKISQNWSVFTEFLYYDFGRATASNSTGSESYSTEFSHEIFQGKLGVNYRF